MEIEGESMPLAGHTGVLTTRHPGNLEKAVGWIFLDPPAALAGLGRKLPHYGKYSYLGFEGEEPTNVIKGQWRSLDSPLMVDLRDGDDRAGAAPALSLPARKALAELPPVFSQKALMAHVSFLASPELEGRGLGTEGLGRAAAYVAQQFESLGLAPGGDDGTYFQKLTAPGPDGAPIETSNVIGILRGSRGDWKDQSLLVTAHYDHLGLGWPDVREGNEGELHPGADDNASGVAVMLELAKSFASGEKPKRTLVFIAFTAEESGLKGSRYYAAHPTFPLEQVIGVINIDTVGRLGKEKLSVIATGTAEEWQHIFRGAGFVTGVESKNIPGTMVSSDQTSFIEKGVPAVQIFTSAHLDYHRPGDTADKIDAAGLVKVATFLKEAVAYLGERPEPMKVTIEGAGAPRAQAAERPASRRRVLFGTVPEFGFPGPGVQVASVVPESPAQKGGVQGGDVLLSIEGQPLADLQGYSDVLKTLEPGQTVSVVLKRDGKEHTISVTLVAR
jgi:hypothetical protein